jgi:hypothetical protein
MKTAIIGKAGRVLPGELALDKLEGQLAQCPLISTADHHGLLNYRLLFNSNLLYSLLMQELKLPFLPVAATGSVPLVNIAYPRGFFFKKQKFNFFSERKSRVPVFLFNSKLTADRNAGVKSFILNYDRNSLTAEEEKFLEHLFFDCLEIEEAARRYDRFSDQITFLNYKLWKYYFDGSIRDSVPGMVYLQVNHIVKRALIDEMRDEGSLISAILFDPDVRLVFVKNFYLIQGAWGDEKGTKFFWGISKKKRYINLELDVLADELVGENFRVPFQREALIEALMEDRILPSLFLDYLVISFLEGYMALGGSNQLDYLPRMQQAHVKSLREIGMEDMAARFASRVTDGLICGMFPFDFDSGIDLIWQYNSRDGKFNGNLDGGITREDLEKVKDMNVQDLILKGVETMLEIA